MKINTILETSFLTTRKVLDILLFKIILSRVLIFQLISTAYFGTPTIAQYRSQSTWIWTVWRRPLRRSLQKNIWLLWRLHYIAIFLIYRKDKITVRHKIKWITNFGTITSIRKEIQDKLLMNSLKIFGTANNSMGKNWILWKKFLIETPSIIRRFRFLVRGFLIIINRKCSI